MLRLKRLSQHRDTLPLLIQITVFVIGAIFLPQLTRTRGLTGVETALNRGVWLIAVDYHRPHAATVRLTLANGTHAAGDALVGRVVLDDGLRVEPQVSVALSAREWTAVAQLHAAWCDHPPTYRRIAAHEAYYEVGVSCGMWHTVTIRAVPVDELPTPFAALFMRVLPRGS